ncbi:MAG: DUF2207 domain-containing protein [Firmicutes bacterium]|nr:DUF2207 domain-containing protein [Bacillota bacterium]
MNEELVKKINKAIATNDQETLEMLKQNYGFSLNIEKNDKVNMLELKTILERNNPEEIKKYQLDNNIKIDKIVRDENGNIKGILLNSTVTREKINPKDMVSDANYFRDLPCDNDLFIIYHLASMHGLLEQESDLIGAFILKWYNENKINIITKKGLFRKKLLLQFNDCDILDSLEKQLYNHIRNISIDNVIDKDIYTWVRKNRFEFNRLLQNIKIDSQIRLKNKGLILLEQNPGNTVVKENDTTYKRVLNSGKATILPKYKEYLNELVGFIKYIKDFSLLNEKGIKDVKLWDDYLVISELLGIAGNVSKDMDYVLPKFKTKNRMKAKGKRIKVKSSELDKYFNK